MSVIKTDPYRKKDHKSKRGGLLYYSTATNCCSAHFCIVSNLLINMKWAQNVCSYSISKMVQLLKIDGAGGVS